MEKAISPQPMFKLLHSSWINCTFETHRSEDIHHQARSALLPPSSSFSAGKAGRSKHIVSPCAVKDCSTGPLSVKWGSVGRIAHLIRLLSTGQHAHLLKTQSRLTQAVKTFILEIHHAGPANEDTRSLLQIHSNTLPHIFHREKRRNNVKCKSTETSKNTPRIQTDVSTDGCTYIYEGKQGYSVCSIAVL